MLLSLPKRRLLLGHSRTDCVSRAFHLNAPEKYIVSQAPAAAFDQLVLQKLDTLDVLDNKLTTLDTKVDTKLTILDTKVDTLR